MATFYTSAWIGTMSEKWIVPIKPNTARAAISRLRSQGFAIKTSKSVRGRSKVIGRPPPKRISIGFMQRRLALSSSAHRKDALLWHIVVKKKIRCAIGTRKSSKDGLEQEFNSLDALREACGAYITGHKAEGWVLLSEEYNDGGIHWSECGYKSWCTETFKWDG